MMRALFYRGRHHVRTAPRPADGGLVTVDTIAARIRREDWPVLFLRIVADVEPLQVEVEAVSAMQLYAEQMARAKAEGLGALA